MAQGCEGRVTVAGGETHRRSGDQASATGKSGCPECYQAQCGTHPQWAKWVRTLAGAQIVLQVFCAVVPRAVNLAWCGTWALLHSPAILRQRPARAARMHVVQQSASSG